MRSSMSAAGFDHQEFVASADVRDHVCGINECGAPPVATYAVVRPTIPGKVNYGLAWGCDVHRNALTEMSQKDMADGGIVTGWTQELLQTCLLDGCDEAATHLVLVARDYGSARRLEGMNDYGSARRLEGMNDYGSARRLEGMSLCEAHARKAENDLRRRRTPRD